jgi:mycofactocin precursor
MSETTAVVENVVPAEEAPLVVEDLLVEDVSIDGMCGVY